MNVELHYCQVTDDEKYPTPWRYWFGTDTPFGYYTDEGLCRTQEECLDVAEDRFEQWIHDKKVQRRTKGTASISVPDDIFSTVEV